MLAGVQRVEIGDAIEASGRPFQCPFDGGAVVPIRSAQERRSFRRSRQKPVSLQHPRNKSAFSCLLARSTSLCPLGDCWPEGKVKIRGLIETERIQPVALSYSERTVFGWFKADGRRKKIRKDRKFLEVRARRFLRGYLAADAVRKHRFYEAVEGASAACQPGITDSTAEDAQIAEATAEAAIKVVKARDEWASDGQDNLARFVTDAYATVAIA